MIKETPVDYLNPNHELKLAQLLVLAFEKFNEIVILAKYSYNLQLNTLYIHLLIYLSQSKISTLNYIMFETKVQELLE